MSSRETASPFHFHQKNNHISTTRNKWTRVCLSDIGCNYSSANTHSEAVQQLMFSRLSKFLKCQMMNFWYQTPDIYCTCSSFSYREGFQTVVPLWAKFEYGTQTVWVETIWCTVCLFSPICLSILVSHCKLNLDIHWSCLWFNQISLCGLMWFSSFFSMWRFFYIWWGNVAPLRMSD